MTTTINASTSAGGGIIQTADASGILALQTAGTTAITIDGSQNVGIGTASPAGKLQIYTAAGTTNFTIQSDSTQIGGMFFNDGANSGAVTYDHSTNAMKLRTNGTDNVLIDSSGNVGINCTPTNLLTVYGANGNTTATSQLKVANTTGTVGATRLSMAIDDANHKVYFIAGGSATNPSINWANNDSYTNTLMTLDSSGNLGIGTSSPSSILQITKNESTAYNGTATDGQLTAGATVFVQQTAGSNTALSQLVFQPRTGFPYNRIVSSGGSAPFMTFVTNDAERARIDSSGNLLVGFTSSASGQNGVLLRGTNSGGSDEVIQARTSGTASKFNTGFYNDNGRVGTINTSGSATSYNTSSDYRLKNSIAPMVGALSRVAALKPVTYKWNVDDSEGEGFIAHELAEVCPHAVSGEKDAVDADGNPVYQGIDTSFLVATLTAAIQEQQALITTLTERITALEAK